MRDGLELFVSIDNFGHNIWLLHTHGIGEHSGRHEYLTDLFRKNFNLVYYDLRGHGKSLGGPTSIDYFWRFMEDLDDIIRYLREEHKVEKYILSGHSMGGLIVCGLVQKGLPLQTYPQKIFISAPPVGITGLLGKIIRLLKIEYLQKLCAMAPNIRIGGLINFGQLSHDETIKETLLKDDLYQKKLSAKLLLELVKASKEVFHSPIHPQCPAFVAYGSEDRIIDPRHLSEYFEKIEHHFTVQEIHGAYHEMHNEIPKYREPYFRFLQNSLVNNTLQKG